MIISNIKVLSNKEDKASFDASSRYGSVSIDCEYTGLCLHRDWLCKIQLRLPNDEYVIADVYKDQNWQFDYIKEILENSHILKIFHFVPMDYMMLSKSGYIIKNYICTKSLSKTVRTNSRTHNLAALVKAATGYSMQKNSQSYADWSEKTNAQDTSFLNYMINDVKYLKDSLEYLMKIIIRDKIYQRLKIAKLASKLIIESYKCKFNPIYLSSATGKCECCDNNIRINL